MSTGGDSTVTPSPDHVNEGTTEASTNAANVKECVSDDELTCLLDLYTATPTSSPVHDTEEINEASTNAAGASTTSLSTFPPDCIKEEVTEERTNAACRSTESLSASSLVWVKKELLNGSLNMTSTANGHVEGNQMDIIEID